MKVDKNASETARRVHKRGLMKKAPFRACDKAEGIIQLESRLEGSVALALSLDPRVVSFRPQPMTIDLNTGRICASKERRDPISVKLRRPSSETGFLRPKPREASASAQNGSWMRFRMARSPARSMAADPDIAIR